MDTKHGHKTWTIASFPSSLWLRLNTHTHTHTDEQQGLRREESL